MANYLVTGGCGFIGYHLVNTLLMQGHQVRILDNLSNDSNHGPITGAERIIGDVADRQLVRDCMESMDGCFHLAATKGSRDIDSEWVETHQANQHGTINVLDTARHDKVPVVYASSSAVYGDNAELRLKETSRLNPMSVYGADKQGSELHARVASMAHQVPTTGLRFFNVYGPGQNPASSCSGVVPVFVDRLLNGKAINIFGDGEQTRDFIYIDDAVEFLVQAMNRIEKSPSVFNVCSGTAVSINQLARSIMSILDVHLPIAYGAARARDIRSTVGDPSHAISRLGVQAGHRLADGLLKLIKHAQAHRADSRDCEYRLQPSSQVCFLR